MSEISLEEFLRARLGVEVEAREQLADVVAHHRILLAQRDAQVADLLAQLAARATEAG